MRIVVCSDIHGNVVALEAVLADINAQGTPDALFVAGDLALDGPRPRETLALLRSLGKARFVMGNTDKDLVDRSDDPAVGFALKHLSSDDIAFLASLPFDQRLEVEPAHELLVVHANPHNFNDHITPDMSDSEIARMLAGVNADMVAFGHYHVPFTRHVGQHTLVDVASVGLPRDGDRRAVYVVLTFAAGCWQIEHRRVPFDMDAVARDYHVVGFPHAEKAAKQLLKARY